MVRGDRRSYQADVLFDFPSLPQPFDASHRVRPSMTSKLNHFSSLANHKHDEYSLPNCGIGTIATEEEVEADQEQLNREYDNRLKKSSSSKSKTGGSKPSLMTLLSSTPSGRPCLILRTGGQTDLA